MTPKFFGIVVSPTSPKEDNMSDSSASRAGKITIHIDGEPYKIHAGPTPVATLRALRQPPVPDDKDLWLDIEGEQDQRSEEHTSELQSH